MAVKTPARKTWIVKTSYDRMRWFGWPAGDKPAPTVPSWVPAAGEVATYSGGGAVLLNHYQDTCHPHFTQFYFRTSRNDYSGGFLNPFWGTYGCMLFWGGGHSGTNQNQVSVLELRANDMEFRRVSDPTLYVGGGNPDFGDIQSEISGAFGEALADGRPCSPHSYGSGEIFGPDYGGAACGSFEQPISSALNYANNPTGVQVTHRIDFANTTDLPSASSRLWTRVASSGTWASTSAPGVTAFVPAQNRVYFISQGGGSPYPVRWYDRASNSRVTGTGVGFDYDEDDGTGGAALLFVPSRSILVCLYRLGGNIKVQWMDVSVSQPTLGSAVTLSASIPVDANWGGYATWCADNNRIVLGGVTGDTGSVRHIEIPATLSNTWTVTTHNFGGGQSIDFPVNRGYKAWTYNPATKSIVFFATSTNGADVVKVLRPAGT